VILEEGSILVGLKKKVPTYLILKTMQSETHIFYFFCLMEITHQNHHYASVFTYYHFYGLEMFWSVELIINLSERFYLCMCKVYLLIVDFRSRWVRNFMFVCVKYITFMTTIIINVTASWLTRTFNSIERKLNFVQIPPY
jgi:hypothetical protein